MAKILLLVYVTWDNEVLSRDNYVMMSKQQPSWTSNYFLKRQKTDKNYLEALTNNKILQKN